LKFFFLFLKNINMSSVSPRRGKAAALTPADFKQKIADLAVAYKAILHAEDQLHKAGKKNEKAVELNGKVYNRHELSSLKKLFYQQFKSLGSDYSSGFNRKKTSGANKGGPNSGLRQPVVMTDVFVDFFRQADLGNARTSNGAGGFTEHNRVQDYLPFLGTELPNIANRGLLTSLLSLYAKKNNLYTLSEYNQARVGTAFTNKQLLGADALMNRVFAQTFANIRVQSAAKLQSGDKGRPLLNAAGQSASDNDRKPLKSKPTSTRERHYFRDFTTVKVPGAKAVKQYGNLHPIWHDFYHVFNPRNFSYSNLQSIVSQNVVKGNDIPADYQRLLVKVDPAVAEAYQAGINASIAAGRDIDYAGIANAALASHPNRDVSLDYTLRIRVSLDSAYSAVAATLLTYAPPKKVKVAK
jgi:hypothetical protein